MMFRLWIGLLLVGPAWSQCSQPMVANNEPGMPPIESAPCVIEEMSTAPAQPQQLEQPQQIDQQVNQQDNQQVNQQDNQHVEQLNKEIENSTPDGGHKVDRSGSGIGETERKITTLTSTVMTDENEGDKILDEIETSKPVDDLNNWNLDPLVEETKKSAERKTMIEKRHHYLQQTKLREQALKLKKKMELDKLVLNAEKRCSQWTTINEESESILYDMFKEGINASLAARDGSKYHMPPVLVEKKLHITALSINAMKCHMSYIESLKVYVDKVCECSKDIRSLLTKYLDSPNENLLLPSIDVEQSAINKIPTRKEINVLKLTAANAHAKVQAAMKEFQMHSARLEALEIEDEKDIDAVGSDDDGENHDDKVAPHMLPIEVLFQHIVGRPMEDEPPKNTVQMLKNEKKRIQREMEDCFGDECDDPKEYNDNKEEEAGTGSASSEQ